MQCMLEFECCWHNWAKPIAVLYSSCWARGIIDQFDPICFYTFVCIHGHTYADTVRKHFLFAYLGSWRSAALAGVRKTAIDLLWGWEKCRCQTLSKLDPTQLSQLILNRWKTGYVVCMHLSINIFNTCVKVIPTV